MLASKILTRHNIGDFNWLLMPPRHHLHLYVKKERRIGRRRSEAPLLRPRILLPYVAWWGCVGETCCWPGELILGWRWGASLLLQPNMSVPVPADEGEASGNHVEITRTHHSRPVLRPLLPHTYFYLTEPSSCLPELIFYCLHLMVLS